MDQERAPLKSSDFLGLRADNCNGKTTNRWKCVSGRGEKTPLVTELPTPAALAPCVTMPSGKYSTFDEGETVMPLPALDGKGDRNWQAAFSSSQPLVATQIVNDYTGPREKQRGFRFVSTLFVWALFVSLAVGCLMVYVRGTLTSAYGLVYLTGYGCLSIGYYFLTMCFAILNRRYVESLRRTDAEDTENAWTPPVAVNVVGYREDPEYFKRCLLSADRLVYSNIRAIVVAIDGNDKDDEEMAEIAMRIFPTAIRIDCRSDPFEDNYESFLRLVPKVVPFPFQHRIVFVVSQPHKGKREALYSAFKVAQKMDAEYFFNTDSDTIVDPMAVAEMVLMTKGRPDVGAVAGELTIFNATNWLSKLTASRYLIAFNVERASLGYHGVVNCISGPMGMYEAAAIVDTMDEWVHQHFLGVKCSFGDDRNLTNRILALGKKVVYTHKATGATETPQSYPRFVAQQTRWSKSYWREMYLQLTWSTLNRSSMFSLFDSLYGLMFPVLLIATLLVDSFYRTWTSLIAIGIMTILTPVLRSLFVYCFLRRDRIVFYNILYPLMYFSTLPAIKVVALFTLKNNNWGTSSRKQIVKTWAPVIPVFVWWSILVLGFVDLSLEHKISNLRLIVQDRT
ncbi:unnamed protein product [Sphacelaria rigidula]